MNSPLTRRDALKSAGLLGSGALLASLTGCEERKPTASQPSLGANRADYAHEEYVWLSANANLPLFTAHDHPAFRLAGQELGVKVTIAGPTVWIFPVWLPPSSKPRRADPRA